MQMTASEIDVKTMQHVRIQIRKSDGMTYHTDQNSFYKWAKLKTLEITIFDFEF